MKKLMIVLAAGILSTLSASAQLGKQMAKYHEKDGITVTQLDRSLYGLYQRENLSPETQEMLQNLEEVNLLNLNLSACPTELSHKIVTQFRDLLNNPDKYRLVKSKNDGYDKQLIYARNKNGKISDLVVWNQTPEQLDLIELRGNIQLDRIALLSRALNLQGLHSLAALSSGAPDGDETFAEEDSESAAEAMQKLNGNFFDGFVSMFNQFFGSRNHRTFPPLELIPKGERTDDLFEDFPFPDMKFFEELGDGENMMSSSVQITEENGKTKLKIDSKNTDIVYIIDGQEMPKDQIQMPEKIRNVNLIPSRQELKKSYLFITSQDKIGSFTSYKEGVLTFNYNGQEYKFNLDKMEEPLLVIDGRLSSDLDIEPSSILQIRPVSQMEKEVGYYPHAEVIINTK